jgi:predicted DNA-binding transcriptional regulator YafY
MEIADQDDGSITVRFGVAGLDWATGWVLRQGPAAKVLAPPDLVARVRTAAQEIAQRYEPC